jgi:hypothetical protein
MQLAACPCLICAQMHLTNFGTRLAHHHRFLSLHALPGLFLGIQRLLSVTFVYIAGSVVQPSMHNLRLRVCFFKTGLRLQLCPLLDVGRGVRSTNVHGVAKGYVWWM